jgi:hypothetical protein
LGRSLLILAGPTMDLSGSVRLFQLPQAALEDSETLLEPTLVAEVPYGEGCDRPEGITLLADHPDQLLVVYDGPASERLVGKGGIRAERLSARSLEGCLSAEIPGFLGRDAGNVELGSKNPGIWGMNLDRAGVP